jgi:hypothetical protein
LAQDEAFKSAMAEVMGCGDAVSAGRIVAVEKALRPIWEVLPKNRYSGVEWRLLRFVVHRYFMKQYSLLVRGLEPSRIVNASHSGISDVLGGLYATPSKDKARRIEAVVEGKGAAKGFSLGDAALLVATIEQLIANQESGLLERAYNYNRKATMGNLDHADLASVIETYMVMWMMNDNMADAVELLKDPKLVAEAIPHWDDISNFANGMVKNLEFTREHSALPGHARAAITHEYSFDDARDVVGSITRSFASFWETECQRIKATLVDLDKDGTGRVHTADFYGSNQGGEWRFGESEAYLRELGALDESSPSGGKYIIIPNYLQGASNCIVTTDSYLVCCVNECEDIMNEIEQVVGAPIASPEVLAPLVGNMTNWDDDAPQLDQGMRDQLQHIAEIHGGRVPLHGRLFAQWLHFVFPRECPFPHKAGDASTVTPVEFGDEYIASEEDVTSHAAIQLPRNDSGARTDDAAPWMSRWSEDEELIADYSAHLGGGPNEIVRRLSAVCGVSSLIVVFWAMWLKMHDESKCSYTAPGVASSFRQKSHFV